MNTNDIFVTCTCGNDKRFPVLARVINTEHPFIHIKKWKCTNCGKFYEEEVNDSETCECGPLQDCCIMWIQKHGDKYHTKLSCNNCKADTYIQSMQHPFTFLRDLEKAEL